MSSSCLSAAVAVLCLSACAAVLDDVAPAPMPAPTVVIRSLPDRPPMLVTEAEFRATMRRLVPTLRLPSLSGLAQAGRVLPAVWVPPPGVLGRDVLQYMDWCGRRHHQQGDCLGVLHGGSTLDEDARYKISFDVALGAEWDGFTQELRGMVDVDTVRVVLVSALITYMILLVVPEPISKFVAMGLTLAATAYLGAQTLWELVQGWLDMVAVVKQPCSFGQLHDAGEVYGRKIGAQTARVLVMLVTAVLSEGGLLQQLPRLPGYARASMALAADTGGLGLGSVAQVRAVTVAAGEVIAELAPAGHQVVQASSLAMAAAKPRGSIQSGKPKPAAPETRGPGEWKKAKSPARGRAGVYQQQVTQHPPDEVYMVNGVEFDGYLNGEDTLVKVIPDEGVLLDAKGKGYARFFQDDLKPESWFKGSGAKKLVAQAKRQIEAAPGVKIRWCVAEEKAADAIRKLLRRSARQIEVVYTPME